MPEPITDAPANTVLALRDLTIVSGQGENARTLVDHVNLDLAHAETLGIVGESGSGKTLTVMSMLGLLPAGTRMTSGRMSLNGKTIDLGKQSQLEALRGGTIGMIFQEPMAALDPCFTVGHHLAEVIRLHEGGSERISKSRSSHCCIRCRIANPEDVARRYPHQISGGMAQRVGIARALAAEPKILLADEPTTALDVTVQAEILELLRALSASRNMAVIIVTHDWGVVADICDRAMVLYQGRALETAQRRRPVREAKPSLYRGVAEGQSAWRQAGRAAADHRRDAAVDSGRCGMSGPLLSVSDLHVHFRAAQRAGFSRPQWRVL